MCPSPKTVTPRLPQYSQQVQNYRRCDCHSAVAYTEFSKAFLGIYSSLISTAYLPMHIKTYYDKSLMNTTGIIYLLQMHSLCPEIPNHQTLWLSFQGPCDLLSIIISSFLAAALVGTCTLHSNIFFSLLLQTTCTYQSPSAPVLMCALEIPLLCKPHPLFKFF